MAVTPFNPACERRMTFDRKSGRVEPVDPNDSELRKMLEEVLVLNHASLVARRLDAFERAGVGLDSKDPLSVSKARELARSVMEFRRGKKLAPFCVAVAQAAEAHASLIEKRAQRRRYRK